MSLLSEPNAHQLRKSNHKLHCQNKTQVFFSFRFWAKKEWKVESCHETITLTCPPFVPRAEGILLWSCCFDVVFCSSKNYGLLPAHVFWRSCPGVLILNNWHTETSLPDRFLTCMQFLCYPPFLFRICLKSNIGPQNPFGAGLKGFAPTPIFLRIRCMSMADFSAKTVCVFSWGRVRGACCLWVLFFAQMFPPEVVVGPNLL